MKTPGFERIWTPHVERGEQVVERGGELVPRPLDVELDDVDAGPGGRGAAGGSRRSRAFPLQGLEVGVELLLEIVGYGRQALLQAGAADEPDHDREHDEHRRDDQGARATPGRRGPARGRRSSRACRPRSTRNMSAPASSPAPVPADFALADISALKRASSPATSRRTCSARSFVSCGSGSQPSRRAPALARKRGCSGSHRAPLGRTATVPQHPLCVEQAGAPGGRMRACAAGRKPPDPAH